MFLWSFDIDIHTYIHTYNNVCVCVIFVCKFTLYHICLCVSLNVQIFEDHFFNFKYVNFDCMLNVKEMLFL